MNRTNKMLCCSHCKTNYQIGDVYGPKNPMLLVCGHDMCRHCIKYLYKKNKQVICKVCQADCMIKCDDEISNIPIHYFIVGKVWYSTYKRQRKIYQDISNIRMTTFPSKSSIKTKENCQNCQNCQKYAAIFCEQCDEAYCADCSQEIHMENHIMSQHDLNKLDISHLELLQASKCDLHLKINDFICITCETELCPVCAVENHRHHDVHHLEKYNISQAQRLNEYSLKGDILLNRLKHYRDKFNEKVQKHRCSNFKKNKNEQNKKDISTYVSSVIGTLQCLEQRFFSMIDQAEQSSSKSMTHVVGQLNSFVDDLQSKLNLLNVLLKTNNYSSIAMLDHIAGIERMLDTTYYLAKKNKAKSSITFDENIYATVQRSVLFDIDTSDRYVLGCSPDLLPEYTLSATIGLNSDDNNGKRNSTLSLLCQQINHG
ncbi:tripartite motif-containing protein 29 isoform X1 [Acyrthosiphon pisum]|uniref:Uncharacterized protein n=2 Tax=Acyrthosiphon pisum TaxID=7029 RepID=A0A8R2NQV2_ACYPI|nr:tripartite motif-containing protein 29 isoform X1 [Acyrthosiphon pisum]XP_029343664.1 tripartite motif-containing protein 29 isoform X1 [Acyrthosiphon pisum]